MPTPKTEGAAPAAPTIAIDRLTRSLQWLALLIVFGFLAFLAYGSIGNRWYRLVLVTGGSMAPSIQRGDLIAVVPPPADPTQVAPGTIGTFSVNGDLVTHRIMGLDEQGRFVTAGDANNVVDDWEEQRVRLVGVYRFRLRYLGLPMLGFAGGQAGPQHE